MTPINPEQALATALTKQGLKSGTLSEDYLTLSGLVTACDRSPLIFDHSFFASFINSGFLPIAQKENDKILSVFAVCAYNSNPGQQNNCGSLRNPDDIGIKFDDCLRITGLNILRESAYFVILDFNSYQELIKNRIWEKESRKNYLNNIDPESESTACVEAIIATAVSLGASDVHIKPDPNFSPKTQEHKVVLHSEIEDDNQPNQNTQKISGFVQYRLLGVLHLLHGLTTEQIRKVVAKIKTMSNLKMDEHRLPQDGRLILNEEMLKKNPYYSNFDFRVSILPTIHGERVVLRLLKRMINGYQIDDLGFSTHNKKQIVQSLEKPKGLFLVIGPTGSGKTTTLYTLLSKLNDNERHILTAEDPVEIQLPGITQVSINERVGLNFATCAKSFMRQDPDVIFIGEIRDSETAIMVAQMVSSGHLVFSTLHADSALGVPGRFENLGVDAKMIIPLLSVVIAQRLARRLCRNCTEEYNGFDEFNDFLDLSGLAQKHIRCLRRGPTRHCVFCSGTGFDKRVLVPELWFPTQEERDLICRGQKEYLVMLKKAKENNFKPMTEFALSLVLDGETSLEELLRSAITREELLRDRVDLSSFVTQRLR